MFKSLVNRSLKVLAPAVYWRRRLAAMRADVHEPELRLVPLLANRDKTSIDIGAAGGVFSAHMLAVSRDCLSFEPRPGPAAELTRMAQALALPMRVEAVALSDQPGSTRLRILTADAGRSTIEADNQLDDPDGSPRVEIEVPVRRVDDYPLDKVGFIKIDVEGHEVNVLQGAQQTITTHQPTLLIEVEDRHKPEATRKVFELMRGWGYSGFYLADGRLLPVAQFNVARHQNPANIGGWKSGWKRTGLYINNFIFVPGQNAAVFVAAAGRLLGAARA